MPPPAAPSVPSLSTEGPLGVLRAGWNWKGSTSWPDSVPKPAPVTSQGNHPSADLPSVLSEKDWQSQRAEQQPRSFMSNHLKITEDHPGECSPKSRPVCKSHSCTTGCNTSFPFCVTPYNNIQNMLCSCLIVMEDYSSVVFWSHPKNNLYCDFIVDIIRDESSAFCVTVVWLSCLALRGTITTLFLFDF